MARGIKRRPRVVWLPISIFDRLGVTPGSPAPNELSPSIFNADFGTLGFPGAVGGSTTLVFPVVADSAIPNAGGFGQPSLSDVANSAYRLRRIVGKVFVEVEQLDDADAAIQGICTIGFIVLRVRSGSDNNVPLDAPFDYNAATITNIGDPWIWRRAWKLGNNAANLLHPAQGFAFWPETNATYGSVMDGPHVDAKTARIVGPEERLFMVITCTTVNAVTQLETLTRVRVQADLRVLASMRTSSGNRRNASR